MSDSPPPSLVHNDEEKNTIKDIKPKTEGSPECAVCLQPSIHPVQLPCSHIFCYLCVKGVTNQSKRCAMCRQEIPSDFLDNPHLLSGDNLESEVTFEDGYQWFYEGRNGWWQYDERTSIELETAYKRGDNRCEVLIAGFLYIINFEHMVQMRRCDPTRRRHIKRDLATVPKKGVAGIRIVPAVANVDDSSEIATANVRLGESSTAETARVDCFPQNSDDSNRFTINAERQHAVGTMRYYSSANEECSEEIGGESSHQRCVCNSLVDSTSSLSINENMSQSNQVTSRSADLIDRSPENELV